MQDDLVGRYRLARRTWADNPAVRQAAATIGMGEREYCDRYVLHQQALWPVIYTSGSANPVVCDANAAYREAGEGR